MVEGIRNALRGSCQKKILRSPADYIIPVDMSVAVGVVGHRYVVWWSASGCLHAIALQTLRYFVLLSSPRRIVCEPSRYIMTVTIKVGVCVVDHRDQSYL